jgi:membrane-bound serine protease (ClpP class)
LMLSSYALQMLPVDWTGVALVLLAFALFVVDLKATNHGLPTAGGIVILVLGILMLFGSLTPYLWVLLIALMVVAVLVGAFFVGALSKVRAAKERPVATGMEGMIGEVGAVREPVGTSFPGWVFVHGEWWRAIAAVAPEDAHKREHKQVIRTGHRVQVVGFQDGKIVVMPFEPATPEHSPKGYR